MAIDPEGVKALFQAAIERRDPAALSLTTKSAMTKVRDRLDALFAAHDQPPSALDRRARDRRFIARITHLYIMYIYNYNKL
jgi:hypothetical protein